MRRWLGLALLLLCAQVAPAQESYADSKNNFAVEKNGGLAVPLGYLTIKDESTARTQRSILTFIGSTVSCADSVANSATECTFTGGGGMATDTLWDAAGDLAYGTGADTGAKLVKGTATQLLHSGNAPTWSAVDLAADVTGVLPFANFTNGSAISVFGRSANSIGVQASVTCAAAGAGVVRESGSALVCSTFTLLNAGAISDTASGSVARGSVIVGNSTPKWAAVTVGAAGTYLVSDGTDTTFRDPLQLAEVSTTWPVVLYEDELCGADHGAFNTAGTAPTRGSVVSAAGHPCYRVTTGGTATGVAAWEGFNTNASTVSGIETVAGTSYVTLEGSDRFSSVGDGTDVIKYYLGGCSTGGSGDCVNGLYLRFDRTASTTNWYLCASDNSSRTCTDTTIAVATGGSTWTNWRIVQNLANNTLSCTINGSACAAGPTTNHPGAGHPWSPMAKMDKTAGSTTAFVMDVDYIRVVMYGLIRN